MFSSRVTFNKEKGEVILEKIKGTRTEIIELTKDLVRIPTYNPPGRDYPKLAELVEKELKELGLQVRIIDVPRERLDELAPQSEGLPRPNVLGVLKGAVRKPVLHFNAHYDVVPPGTGWSITKPFDPIVKNDKLYGRGTCDMKGGLTAVIVAAKAIVEAEIKLKGDLVISATPDEETGGQAGLGFLVKEGYLKDTDYAVIPEPSGLKGFHPAHKGDLWLEITIKGKAAHAGIEFTGINAFMKAAKVALTLETELKPHFRNKPSKYPIKPEDARYPTICIGGVAKGGIKINVVPDEFTFTVDRRVNPDETVGDAYKEIMSVIERLKREDPELNVAKIKKIVEASPAATPMDHPLCNAMDRVLTEILGQTPTKTLAPFFADMRFLNETGIPSIIYGPGEIEQAHTVDEYCYVSNIITCAKALALLAIELLDR